MPLPLLIKLVANAPSFVLPLQSTEHGAVGFEVSANDSLSKRTHSCITEIMTMTWTLSLTIFTG